MNYLKISNFALQDNGNSIEIPSTDPLFKHLKLVKYVDQSKIAGNTVLCEDTEKQFDDDDFEVALCGPSNMVAGVLVSSVADLVRDSIKDTAVSSEAGASKVWNPVSLPTQPLKNAKASKSSKPVGNDKSSEVIAEISPAVSVVAVITKRDIIKETLDRYSSYYAVVDKYGMFQII
jgi:hypothetical protein